MAGTDSTTDSPNLGKLTGRSDRNSKNQRHLWVASGPSISLEFFVDTMFLPGAPDNLTKMTPDRPQEISEHSQVIPLWVPILRLKVGGSRPACKTLSGVVTVYQKTLSIAIEESTGPGHEGVIPKSGDRSLPTALCCWSKECPDVMGER
jgi:hypothetical protein